MNRNGPARGKVVVAMSGGVDSSVAAALLLRRGYEVVGCFMRLGNAERSQVAKWPSGQVTDPCSARSVTGSLDHSTTFSHQGCCSVEDARDAQLVAAHLNIPLYVLNFQRDFGRVIDYFVDEYHAGRTPNPCVRCNDWLKFGRLWDYARSLDAHFIASGHYARVEKTGTGVYLSRGVDHAKDQSYVLFGTKRHHLAHLLLPIGNYRKQQVRDLARELGLPVHDKPDSQEICFVPDQDYAGLLQRRSTTPAPGSIRPGDVLDNDGKVLGRHGGHQRFTIGQRRGLGVATGVPLYVLRKDAVANTVTVGPRNQLASTGLIAREVNWFIDPVATPLTLTVKIRYNAKPAPATVVATGEDEITVRFDEPQDAVSPGQAAVCYDGDRVIVGGWITSPVDGAGNRESHRAD